MVSAWVCFVIALFILILCLILLVTLLRRLLAGASTHILYKATHIHPFFAMVIGCAITILVRKFIVEKMNDGELVITTVFLTSSLQLTESSSITTSK